MDPNRSDIYRVTYPIERGTHVVYLRVHIHTSRDQCTAIRVPTRHLFFTNYFNVGVSGSTVHFFTSLLGSIVHFSREVVRAVRRSTSIRIRRDWFRLVRFCSHPASPEDPFQRVDQASRLINYSSRFRCIAIVPHVIPRNSSVSANLRGFFVSFFHCTSTTDYVLSVCSNRLQAVVFLRL